jgi:hypothetical protein
MYLQDKKGALMFKKTKIALAVEAILAKRVGKNDE